MISLVIFQKIKINNNIIINFVFFQSFDLINWERTSLLEKIMMLVNKLLEQLF